MRDALYREVADVVVESDREQVSRLAHRLEQQLRTAAQRADAGADADGRAGRAQLPDSRRRRAAGAQRRVCSHRLPRDARCRHQSGRRAASRSRLCADALSAAGHRQRKSSSCPMGKRTRTGQTLYEIHTRLLELGAERSTTLIALGGGVIGDSRDSRPRRTSAGCRSCRCPRRCWRRSTRRSAARRRSIIRSART